MPHQSVNSPKSTHIFYNFTPISWLFLKPLVWGKEYSEYKCGSDYRIPIHFVTLHPIIACEHQKLLKTPKLVL